MDVGEHGLRGAECGNLPRAMPVVGYRDRACCIVCLGCNIAERNRAAQACCVGCYNIAHLEWMCDVGWIVSDGGGAKWTFGDTMAGLDRTIGGVNTLRGGPPLQVRKRRDDNYPPSGV
jgi:hypothetical protein